jgi:hypothetical protein
MSQGEVFPMKTDILSCYRFNLWFLDRLLADIPAEKLTAQPGGLKNHPLWTVGHLAWTNDVGVMVQQSPRLCPPEWTALFGRESQPVEDAKIYPTLEVVRAALEAGHARLAEIYLSADQETLGKPNPHPRLGTQLPTIGAQVIFSMIGHESLHLGQLSAWRRCMGFAPMF